MNPLSVLPTWARRSVVAVLWLAALVAAAERLHHARKEFANPPDAPPDKQRADGNHGHAEIDFAGQWVMGRMVATGHARELYHRQRQWEVVRRGFPEEAESPYVRRNVFPQHLRDPGAERERIQHDAEGVMDWFMGVDSPRWKQVGPAVTAPFATDPVVPNPIAAVALTVASGDRLTGPCTEEYGAVCGGTVAIVAPDLVAEVNRPAIGGPLYPPVHAFMYAPLGLFEKSQQAYYAYQIFTVLLTFFAGYGVAVLSRGRIPWPAAVLAILLYPGYRSGLDLAQNQVLSLTMLIWGWALAVRGRETLGGAVWGLLAFKPVWGLAFFVVPLLMRRWRFCAAMVVTGAGLCAATLPFTGIQAWFDWLAVGREASGVYLVNYNWVFLSRDLSGLVRRALIDFGLPEPERGNSTATQAAWGLWFTVFLTTVAVYLIRGRARFPTGLAAGFLGLGAYLCCYRFMYYDALQSVLPLAMLFADPVRAVRPTAIELRSDTGLTRTGVLNSVPLTLFAVLLALENWLLWLAAELTVRFGAFARVTSGADGATTRHVPALTAETTVYYAWDTIVLLLLWAWCGWRLVVGGDFGEPADEVKA